MIENEQSKLVGWLSNLVRQASTRGAVSGNGAGVVDVPNRPNWIYVRLGASDGEIAEVRTSTIHPNYDDSVLVMRDNPTRLGGHRMVFWLRDANDATLPAPVVGSGRTREVLLDSDAVPIVDSDGILMEAL